MGIRTIIFRGKRKDNGEWVEGYLYVTQKGQYEISRYSKSYDCERFTTVVIPETVGQYTGLTDKNGTNIFEGDIVLMPNYGKGKHKTAVYFKNGKFAVDGTNYSFKDLNRGKTLEVIGNIHDNHELLERG